VTLERQARPRTARVKRQRKNSSANNKLAVTVGTVGASPKIIFMELPNVNIPKTVNHPSIVYTPPGRHRTPTLSCSLFVRPGRIQPPNGASEYKYQGKWNASLKPKTTHEKDPAEAILEHF
jgi:hypothetical protein